VAWLLTRPPVISCRETMGPGGRLRGASTAIRCALALPRSRMAGARPRFFSGVRTGRRGGPDLGCGWGEFIRHVEAGRKYAMGLNSDAMARVRLDTTFPATGLLRAAGGRAAKPGPRRHEQFLRAPAEETRAAPGAIDTQSTIVAPTAL